MNTRRVLQVVFGVLLIASGLQAADDPTLGTWKLNVAKSKFRTGPQSQTARIEPSTDGVKWTVDTITAEGKTTHFELFAKYDGKDYPVSGNPNANTITLTRLDDHSIQHTWKKDGKIRVAIKDVISADGKTWTATIPRTNPQGESWTETQVFERQ